MIDFNQFKPTHTVYINGVKCNISFDFKGFLADNPSNRGVPCSYHRIKKEQFIEGCMLYSSGNTYSLLKSISY